MRADRGCADVICMTPSRCFTSVFAGGAAVLLLAALPAAAQSSTPKKNSTHVSAHTRQHRLAAHHVPITVHVTSSRLIVGYAGKAAHAMVVVVDRHRIATLRRRPLRAAVRRASLSRVRHHRIVIRDARTGTLVAKRMLSVASSHAGGRLPTISITSAPPASSTNTVASVAWSSTAASSTVCNLDQSAASACTSPASFTVAPGDHAISIAVVNKSGVARAAVSFTVTALPLPTPTTPPPTTTTTTTTTTTATPTPTTTTTPTPSPTPPAVASATGVDNADIALTWPTVAGATSYRILRTARLVGSTSGNAFTDNLLWPQTTYSYAIQATGADGSLLDTMTATGTTTSLPVIGFARPFSATSFWNVPISASAATSSQNAGLLSYFVAHATNPSLSIGDWSVPVAQAHPSDTTFSVPCLLYVCTLGAFGPFAIPVTAVPAASSDGHLAVYDPASGREWDMWQAKSTGSSWSASAGSGVSMSGTGVAPGNTGAGDAANFPLLGGLVRPEEIAQGHIDHALVFGIQGIGVGSPVCPASHNAATSTDPNALREGMQLQLDPTIDVNSLPIPSYAKVMARAMQVYGMYVRDNAGSLGVYGENPVGRGYNPWPAVLGTSNTYPSLAGIPWSKFRIVSAPNYPNC
jgi:hypothetical protein